MSVDLLVVDPKAGFSREKGPGEDDFVFSSSAIDSLFDGAVAGAAETFAAVAALARIFALDAAPAFADVILILVKQMGENGGGMRESKLPFDSTFCGVEVTAFGFDGEVYLVGDWEEAFGPWGE